MSFLENIYKEIILEHSKRPRNQGTLDPSTVSQEGLNPSCGDELELHLQIENDVITAVKFSGEGCAISQSSASMMTEAIKGMSLAEAEDLSAKFKEMIHGKEPSEELGELKMLQGISKLHARVKCATLGWITLEQALERYKSST